MTVESSRGWSVRREVAHAYAAGACGLVVCVASAAVGALVGLLYAAFLGAIVFGYYGFLIGVVLGVVTAVMRVDASRVRAGLAMLFACGVTGGMFMLFHHHSWVFVVAVLSVPGFAAMGSLTRQSRRSLVVVAAGTAALVGLLLLDVWVGESPEVGRVERRFASAGVDLWVPPMDPGCDILVWDTGWVQYRLIGCGDRVTGDPVMVVLTRADLAGNKSALGPNPQIYIQPTSDTDGVTLPPAHSVVASMRRGDTVIEVESTLGHARGRVLAVAQGLRREDAGWLATRDAPLHRWVHDLLR